MNFNHKKYAFCISAVVFCIFAFFIRMQAQTPHANEQIQPTNLWANAGISGAWRINFAESENAMLKMQTLLKTQIAQNAEAQNADAKPTISISLLPPETLVLAKETENQMTINEGYNSIILTRTIFTDGKTQLGRIEGENFYITANQSKENLKIETVSPRGNKMTEIFEISGDGKKLSVTLRINDPSNKEMISLKRVYDRTLLDVFDGVSNEMN